MVALFLRTEITSVRFRAKLLERLEKAGLPESLLLAPDPLDAEANRTRRELLGEYRGYGRDEDYFEGFPDNLRWEWELLTPEEVARVKYIDYSYWNELSGGTRLPSDAAPRIRAGIAPFGVSSERALSFADTIANGASIPPMIFVAPEESGDLVVLEGHARLTAYMLRPEALPAELPVLVGYSPDIVKWGCYQPSSPN
jgi:hypothetical protein